MYRIFIVFWLLYLSTNILVAQSEMLHEIKSIPTKQIFDLMTN